MFPKPISAFHDLERERVWRKPGRIFLISILKIQVWEFPPPAHPVLPSNPDNPDPAIPRDPLAAKTPECPEVSPKEPEVTSFCSC